MMGVQPLKWSDVAGHPVVVCPSCQGDSESGSANYESLKAHGLCCKCKRKEEQE